MNAYELADELHEDLQWIVTSNTDLPSRLASAINMLRQQADRIAELEDKLSFYEIKDLDSGLKPKPLSDEEIEYYEHLIAKLFNCSVTQKVVGLDRVIRAIEERHGIK